MVGEAKDLVGRGPLVFADETGAQKVFPLSAFELDDQVALKSAWAALLKPATQLAVLELVKVRLAAGELAPPPVPPRLPAVTFAAQNPGVEGNGITVTVDADSVDLFAAKVSVRAVQTETYAGLADVTALAKAMGVDAAPVKPDDPRQGTGLLQVKGKPTGSDLPMEQTIKVKTSEDLKGPTAGKVFCTLVARDGPAPKDITVEVTVDKTTKLFTLTVTYDSGVVTKPLIALSTLDPEVAYIVEAGPPAGGYAVPADSTVQLSGGSDGIPATGVAYTR